MTRPSPLRSLTLALLALCAGGCTYGYRYTNLGSTHTEDGRSVDVQGDAHAFLAGVVLDFRYFRLGVPFEGVVASFELEDELGGIDRFEDYDEMRSYRLDVPLLTIFDLDEDVWWRYPGVIRHRQGIELWASASSNLSRRHHWFADLSVAYYDYNGLGVRLFGGWGEIPFRASTQGVGPEFPLRWEGQAGGFGGGLEVTLTTGEYALEALKWLIDRDREERREFDR